MFSLLFLRYINLEKGVLNVDQKKIGVFFKKLRNEKGITQEQLAEKIGVSNRSVSRWENGIHMPDLDILILIADYYEVELSELLDGERKERNMDKEKEDMVLKVAEYSNSEKMQFSRRVNMVFLAGTIGFVIFLMMEATGLSDSEMYGSIADFALGVAFGVSILGVLYTSKYMSKIKEFKMRLIQKAHKN